MTKLHAHGETYPDAAAAAIEVAALGMCPNIKKRDIRNTGTDYKKLPSQGSSWN